MENRPPENDTPIEGSKYSLVVAVAKRARQIVERKDPGVVLPHKPVIIALDEIESGAVKVVTKPEPAVPGENAAAAADDSAVPQDPAAPEESSEKPRQ